MQISFLNPKFRYRPPKTPKCRIIPHCLSSGVWNERAGNSSFLQNNSAKLWFWGSYVSFDGQIRNLRTFFSPELLLASPDHVWAARYIDFHFCAEWFCIKGAFAVIYPNLEVKNGIYGRNHPAGTRERAKFGIFHMSPTFLSKKIFDKNRSRFC